MFFGYGAQVDKDLITAEKWVAQDGSDVDYGNIHQQEFYNADSTSRLFPLRYLEHHSGHCNYLGNEGKGANLCDDDNTMPGNSASGRV